MPTENPDGKPKAPGLEHEKGPEAVGEGQEKVDAQLRAEVEQLETAVGALEGEIAVDLKALDASDVTDQGSAYFAAQAEARAELERVATSARGILSAFLGSVADIFYHQPVEAAQDFMAAREAKALAIPDNPNIIKQLFQSLEAIQKKIHDQKRLARIESQFRKNMSDSSESFLGHLEKNPKVREEYDNQVYDEGVKADFLKNLTLFKRAGKVSPDAWSEVEGRLESFGFVFTRLKALQGDPQKLAEWWPTVSDLPSIRRIDNVETFLMYLNKTYREDAKLDEIERNQAKMARPDFTTRVDNLNAYLDQTINGLAAAPELQTALRLKHHRVIDHAIFNAAEQKALSVLSPEHAVVWDQLGDTEKRFVLGAASDYGTTNDQQRAWRIILAHPNAAALAHECVAFIEESRKSFSGGFTVVDFITSKQTELVLAAQPAENPEFTLAYEAHVGDPNVKEELLKCVSELPKKEAGEFVRLHADRLPWALVVDPNFLETQCGLSRLEISWITREVFKQNKLETVAASTPELDTFTIISLLDNESVYQNNINNLGLFMFLFDKHKHADSAKVLNMMMAKDPFTTVYVCADVLAAATADLAPAVKRLDVVPGLLKKTAIAVMGGLINSYGHFQKDRQNPEFILENFEILGLSSDDMREAIAAAHWIDQDKLIKILRSFARHPDLASSPEFVLLLGKANTELLVDEYEALGLSPEQIFQRAISERVTHIPHTPVFRLLRACADGRIPLADEQLVSLLATTWDMDNLAIIYELQNKHPLVAKAVRDHFNPPVVGQVDVEAEQANVAALDSSLAMYLSFVNRSKDDKDLLSSKAVEYLTKNPQKGADVVDVLTDCQAWEGGLDRRVTHSVIGNLDKIIKIEKSKRKDYIEVLEAVSLSPSQEVQRIVESLLPLLLDTDDPKAAYHNIESIFIKNNLPLVGKVYKIFEVLFPKEKMDKVLENPILSPVLRKTEHVPRMRMVYADLLRVHLDSDNRSLRHYLQILQEGEAACQVLDRQDVSDIASRDLNQIKYFISKLNTLFLHSQLAESAEAFAPLSADCSLQDIKDIYAKLRESLGVRSGQKTTERIADVFLRPLGYRSIEEALQAMKQKKHDAGERGRQRATQLKQNGARIESGDLLKGVDAAYIAQILQNGSVAKEYLGASSDSDYTPFDTDLELASPAQVEASFDKALHISVTHDYGDIVMVVKDRGQFQTTSADMTTAYDPKKYELFQTGRVSENHYGIRTGFATTEIDLLVCKNNEERARQDLYWEIAKNGYYIPVVDTAGQLIFSPEAFDKARQVFSGLEFFDGGMYQPELTTEKDPHFKAVEEVRQTLPGVMEKVREANARINSTVAEVLSGQGIKLKEPFDTSLLGAELLDTGSTGRHTNLAEGFDFDLVLKLDLADEKKVTAIVENLQAKLNPTSNESYFGHSRSDIYQLRFFGASGLGDAPVDIDIAFVRKSELSTYGSHDAVRDKLDNIKTNFGTDAHESVLANIIVAKQMLKKAGAYKKGKDSEGGLGGIGVENWVLAHGGNLARACEAFRAAAYDGERQRTLDEFKQVYQINDPGVNAKFLKHDNFVELLTEAGYTKMLGAIEVYCKTS